MIDFDSLPPLAVFEGRDGRRAARVKRETIFGENIDRAFDYVDSKGRRIGGRVSLSTVNVVADETGDSSLLARDWLGFRFVACPGALRDGRSFGAIQRNHYFETVEERDAYVVKYFRDAEKRAAKSGRPA